LFLSDLVVASIWRMVPYAILCQSSATISMGTLTVDANKALLHRAFGKVFRKRATAV